MLCNQIRYVNWARVLALFALSKSCAQKKAMIITWSHKWHVLALVDDGPGDVGVEDVDAEGKDPELDKASVAGRLLGRPPADQSQGDVEHRGQTLRYNEGYKQVIVFMVK